MKVTMFLPRFVDPILVGTKRNTIRQNPKRPPKVGEKRSLRYWSGKPYNSKQVPFAVVEITAVVPVIIHEDGPIYDGVPLCWGERDTFAQHDGFKDWPEMREHFQNAYRLPVSGLLYRWEPGKLERVNELPNAKGETRCEAVGRKAEGKVPTTAPDETSPSPGSNEAAGAMGRLPAQKRNAPSAARW